MFKKILLPILLGILGILALIAISVAVLLNLPDPEPLLPKQVQYSFLIKDVHIPDLEADTLKEDLSIWIENNRIKAIGNSDTFALPADIQIVNGEGKYAIPALWDMHTHLISNQAPQLNMPLFIAAGVTHIRELGGGPSLEMKNLWTEQIEKRELLGPQIASKAAFMAYYFEDDAEAIEWVGKVEDPKDFIKTYNAILPGPYNAMANEAKAKGISFLGHKPRSISTIHAAKMGHKSFEHARVFLYDCFPGAEEVQEEYRARISGEKEGKGAVVDTRMRQRMVDEHDPKMFEEVVRVLNEEGAWYVPTHITRKMDAFADNKEFLEDPRLKYICFPQQFAWTQDTKGMVKSDPSPEGRKAYMDFYKKGLELSGRGYELGLRILAGTDANDTYCIPGLSLHDELEELVKGGLKPHQALLTATRNPAQYYGWERDYGSITEGKIADILLLRENPLEDISRTTGIHAVIYHSALYEREDLDAMLEYVEENASSLSLSIKLIEEKI